MSGDSFPQWSLRGNRMDQFLAESAYPFTFMPLEIGTNMPRRYLKESRPWFSASFASALLGTRWPMPVS